MTPLSLSLLSGLTGFVVIEILCRPTDIFGWWPPLLRRALFGSDKIVDFEDMKWWQLAIYKPLAGCGVCFSGWVGIVVFLVHFDTDFFHPFFFMDARFYDLIFFLCGAIFTAWVLDSIQEKVFK